jgi:hypothetical protein
MGGFGTMGTDVSNYECYESFVDSRLKIGVISGPSFSRREPCEWLLIAVCVQSTAAFFL